MSLIRFQNLSKKFDDRLILREVFFRLSPQDRVGFIGRNGMGKTTVLKMILGQEEATSGTIEINRATKLGYFSQFSELSDDESVVEVLNDLFSEVHAVQKELSEIEAAMATPQTDEAMQESLDRMAILHSDMERLDGWTIDNKIDTVLTKLGFNNVRRDRPMSELSGGWRNRAALAKVLMQAPDVLLMDEPTNFLDVDGIAWLEKWLCSFRGALIVISHDRQFLDNVANRIVEIENNGFQEYDGGFSEYILEKRCNAKKLQSQFQHEEELLVLETEAITRRQSSAKSANPNIKKKMAYIKKKKIPRPVDQIVTNLYQSLSAPTILCKAEGLSKSFGDEAIIKDFSFQLNKRERLAIVGPNGCGKTTLVKILTGAEPADLGSVKWFGSTEAPEFCYYNDVFDNLDLSDTVSHCLNVTPLAFFHPRKLITKFLGMLQFSDADMKQRIGTLSGGQKARVALASCLLSGSPTIILDEPTNYLDLTSTQVMERALVHFPGAVIVISHDRFFIDKVATRLILFDEHSNIKLKKSGRLD